MPFLYLNWGKLGLGGKELFRIMNPGSGTVQRISCNASCLPHLLVIAIVAVCGKTVYTRKVILPGITSSRTRNPQEEWLPRMWQFAVTLYSNSSGNNKLKDEESTRGMVIPL
jgi:hypothetical protein